MKEEFAKDLIKAQSEMETLPKDKQGYGYKYTDFDTVVKTIRPILAKNNIGFAQLLDTKENGKSGITTIVFHSSGESFQSWFELPTVVVGKANNAQNAGASISYIKRYALCSVFGLSADEDTDGVPGADIQKRNAKPQNNQSNENGYYPY